MVAKLQNNYMHINTAKFQKIFVNLPCHNTKTKYYPKIIPFWVQYTKKTVEVIFYYSMVMNEKTFFLNDFLNYNIAKNQKRTFYDTMIHHRKGIWYDTQDQYSIVQAVLYCSIENGVFIGNM